MKKIILFTCMVFVTFATFANQASDELLKKFSQKMKGYSTIEADFSFTLKNDQENINDSQDGKLTLKGNFYKLEMMGMTIYSDGETNYSYMEDAQEVNITSAKQDDTSLNPATIFSSYEKGFKSDKIVKASVDGKQVSSVFLYPTTEKEYSKVKLYIDKEYHLVKAETYANDGNVYVVLVKKLETNKNFSDSYFKFDQSKNPDVEVIDMR